MNWLDIIRSWFRTKSAPKPGPVNPVPASAVIAALNTERARYDLEPLTESAVLDAAAHAWAQLIAGQGVLTHGDFEKRIADMVPGHAIAENIAEGQQTVAQVVAAWMGSPGHRANILGPYSQAGHGEAIDARGNRYWVVDFAS